MEKGKVIKYILGAGLVIGGASYIYYNYLHERIKYYFSSYSNNSSPSSSSLTINTYTNMYLEKLKLKINLLYEKNSKTWLIDQSILCHINYLIKEIISNLFPKNTNNKGFGENKKYIIKNVIEKYFGENFSDIEPFLNDNLIFLPVNQKFLPLIRHDEEQIKKILESNDKQTIEDSFFFASVNQIELDKKLEKIENFYEKNKFEELLKFKENFQIEFVNRYKYDSKYLLDVYYYTHCIKKNDIQNDISISLNNINCIYSNSSTNTNKNSYYDDNSYLKNEDVQFLINKITY